MFEFINADVMGITTVLMNVATILTVIILILANKRNSARDRESKHKELLRTMLAEQEKKFAEQQMIDQRFRDTEQRNIDQHNDMKEEYRVLQEETKEFIETITKSFEEFKSEVTIKLKNMEASNKRVEKSLESFQNSFLTIIEKNLTSKSSEVESQIPGTNKTNPRKRRI